MRIQENVGRTAEVAAMAAMEDGRMAGKVSVDWDNDGNLRITLGDQEAVDWFDDNIYYRSVGPPNAKYDWKWPAEERPVPLAHHKTPERKFISPRLKDGDQPSKGIVVIEPAGLETNSPPMDKVCPCKLNPNGSCE